MQPRGTNHSEVYKRPGEAAKRAFGTALGRLEGAQVHLEPLITGTQRRNDSRITGSASSGLSSEDIDITIISLASQDSQTATLPLATTEDDSMAVPAVGFAVSREEHSMGRPGAEPTAMRPVMVCKALRTTGTRRASARRWWVQPEIPGAVSGFNDLKASIMASSGGISPFLGPAVVPNGEGGPAGFLARRASTTASVTVATTDFPLRVRAAEPKRPISTCLVAVGAPPRHSPSPLASGAGQSTLGYLSRRSLIPLPRLSAGTSPTLGKAGRSSRVSSDGLERKLSASLAAAEQNAAAVAADSGLKTVVRCTSERKRSLGDAVDGVEGERA
ncbi:hypothetical protein EHS25_004774 [Saitozyma podzolica]|uniref:Uncharacterized protein n=1 Tax=Saitozyma podzolica TaxID=1890683 RepID=A0A427Y2M7_9TREE|nr:hypothetical protein EHS25_004774 [Saitozyma podzolica]